MSDSTVIAEISLSHPKLVLTPTIEAVPEVTTELEYQAIAHPNTYYLFFTAYGESFERFDRAVAEDPTVCDVSVSIDTDGFRFYRMQLTSTEGLVLPKAAELGLRVLQAKSGAGGWVATLQIPDLDALKTFRSYCQEHDVTFTLDRLYRDNSGEHSSGYGLTAIQQETLLVAYEHGYFNDPRDVSVEDLAAILEVSSSAVSSRLRRAMAALVGNTIAQPSSRR